MKSFDIDGCPVGCFLDHALDYNPFVDTLPQSSADKIIGNAVFLFIVSGNLQR